MKTSTSKPQLRLLDKESNRPAFQEASGEEYSQREIHNLASSVCTTLYLHRRNNFIAVIGNGDEPTHEEAIYTWLKPRYHLYTHIPKNERLHTVCMDLKTHILENVTND